MPETKICPKYNACPIYTEKILDAFHSDLYKNLYCKAGFEKFSKCKRYIVSEKTGQSPPADILPNSILTVEEIIDMMKEK